MKKYKIEVSEYVRHNTYIEVEAESEEEAMELAEEEYNFGGGESQPDWDARMGADFQILED